MSVTSAAAVKPGDDQSDQLVTISSNSEAVGASTMTAPGSSTNSTLGISNPTPRTDSNDVSSTTPSPLTSFDAENSEKAHFSSPQLVNQDKRALAAHLSPNQAISQIHPSLSQHPFYPSPHPQPIYHPPHPAFAHFQPPPFSYSPYFQPHPVYPVHHNWTPAPVAHATFHPPHPTFYWPTHPQPGSNPNPHAQPHPQQAHQLHQPHHQAHTVPFSSASPPHSVLQRPVQTSRSPSPVLSLSSHGPPPQQPDAVDTRRRRQNGANGNVQSRLSRPSRPPHPPDAPHESNGVHSGVNTSRRGSRRRGSPQSSDDKLFDGDRDKIERGKHSDSVELLVASSSAVSSSSDRKNSANKSSGRPPQGDNSSDKDLSSLTGDLDKSARKAVASADDVTLALLLTSWANSLSEARQHAQTPATQFESVFRASQALDIVANEVLQSYPKADSPVRKALTSLLGFVLYGDHRLYVIVCELVTKLNAELARSDGSDVSQEIYARYRDNAVSRTLAFLKTVSSDVRAFSDILPNSPEVRDRPSVPVNGVTQSNGVGSNGLEAVTGPATHAGIGAGPAGPDPTKAVERSMDAWRRAVARLQGELALITVLNKAISKAEIELCAEDDSSYRPVENFFSAVQQAIRKHMEADVAARTNRLKVVYWADVVVGAETTVLQAIRDHAECWIRQFVSSQTEVERQLDEAGIGFGPSARVNEEKFPVLLSASAGIAALVSCQQRGFAWAGETSKILTAMVEALHCLENAADGQLGPSAELKAKFYDSIGGAFSSIDEVVDWSFELLCSKVLGSLEKSCGNVSVEIEDPVIQRPRALRFEEPPKTPVAEKETGENGQSSVNRRKMRHVRMKSSPDALLHLNARMDDYSDNETDVDRNVDREIEFTDDKDDQAEDGNINVSIEIVETCKPIALDEAVLRTACPTGPAEIDGSPTVGDPKGLVDDDDDEADDRDIIVHDDESVDDGPRKVHSHIRSMSVDGIPF